MENIFLLYAQKMIILHTPSFRNVFSLNNRHEHFGVLCNLVLNFRLSGEFSCHTILPVSIFTLKRFLIYTFDKQAIKESAILVFDMHLCDWCLDKI